MVYTYGPPYVAPAPIPFVPANTTGWQWSVRSASGSLRGLLQVLPAGVSTNGTVCDDNFDILAAQAVCYQVTGKYVEYAYAIPMPVSQTPATGPIYAGNFNCPAGTAYSGVGGCELVIASGGDYPCVHTQDVYIDCTNDPTGYTGNITFYMIALTPVVSEFQSAMAAILSIPESRIMVTVNHSTGAYNYYNLQITEGSGSDPAMSDINRQIETLDALLLDQNGIYEYWSSTTRPNGDADITGTGWNYTLVSPPRQYQRLHPKCCIPHRSCHWSYRPPSVTAGCWRYAGIRLLLQHAPLRLRPALCCAV